jgi:dephospho-CoA kinase
MLKLGITGGIGSGKSTVCGIFSHLGVPVYHADERAKWLVDHDAGMRSEIIEAFGEKSFKGDTYNREYIASIVFKDKARLEKLNSIIHPVVLKYWESFCAEHGAATYVIKEAAIMLEAGGREVMDKIILVYSPKELRMQRLIARDQLSPEAIEARMNSQMPEEEKMKLADYIIYNDSEHSLLEQVRNIHHVMDSSGWMS